MIHNHFETLTQTVSSAQSSTSSWRHLVLDRGSCM